MFARTSASKSFCWYKYEYCALHEDQSRALYVDPLSSIPDAYIHPLRRYPVHGWYAYNRNIPGVVGPASANAAPLVIPAMYENSMNDRDSPHPPQPLHPRERSITPPHHTRGLAFFLKRTLLSFADSSAVMPLGFAIVFAGGAAGLIFAEGIVEGTLIGEERLDGRA